MLDYIFFDDTLRTAFIEFARAKNIVYVERQDSMGTVVATADDLDEETSDALETRYDELMGTQATLTDRADGDANKHLAVVHITLDDGTPHIVTLEPEMANRLLGAFSVDEIQTLFSHIARSVTGHEEITLCHS